MTTLDIAHRRLFSQRLLGAKVETPDDVVSWLGAVQAQAYAGAKWALAMRAPCTTDADVEQAFASGAILRTHLLRPTWHFITPADIRWVLSLTAPRVQATNAYMSRKLGLDAAALRRSSDTLLRTSVPHVRRPQCTIEELKTKGLRHESPLERPRECRTCY